MSRRRLAGSSLILALLSAAPAAAQAPQFRADIRRTGDEPFAGTMYFGNGRMRIEGVSGGQQMTMIVDGGSGSLIMLMPADRMYVTMDVGSAPFSAPGASSMDPANPCSSGEVSDCRSLGSETVNGVAARGWEYTRDGERETAWIANELRFPVRTIEADGATTDMTNVAMGPQPSSLFEPPSDYTAMDMPAFGGLGGGGRGRGGRGGRGGPPPGTPTGAVPPGARGRGAPPAGLPPVPAGIDPSAIAQMQAMGLDSATIAMMLNMGTATNSAPWEAGDGWVADLVVTASGSDTGSNEGGRWTDTYSARFEASVPFTYGTPAVGAQMGPAWQLVPTLGSPRGLAEPFTLSGTTEFRRDGTRAAACPAEDGSRTVVVSRGTAQTSTTDHGSMEIMMAQARWEISGDLRTHRIAAAPGTTGTEATETTTSMLGACGDPPSTSTDRSSIEKSMGFVIDLGDLPLAASPATMRGTRTTPMRFEMGAFSGELDATVEWTLRPIS